MAVSKPGAPAAHVEGFQSTCYAGLYPGTVRGQMKLLGHLGHLGCWMQAWSLHPVDLTLSDVDAFAGEA